MQLRARMHSMTRYTKLVQDATGVDYARQVIDTETGHAYFDSMRHSLTTSFRILVGEWNDVMVQAVAETTEATQLW